MTLGTPQASERTGKNALTWTNIEQCIFPVTDRSLSYLSQSQTVCFFLSLAVQLCLFGSRASCLAECVLIRVTGEGRRGARDVNETK